MVTSRKVPLPSISVVRDELMPHQRKNGTTILAISMGTFRRVRSAVLKTNPVYWREKMNVPDAMAKINMAVPKLPFFSYFIFQKPSRGCKQIYQTNLI